MSEVDQLISKGTSAAIRKATKLIADKSLIEYGDKMFSLLEGIISDKRKWETICAIIRSLGIIEYRPLLPIIEGVIRENEEHDMITLVSGSAFVRLTRSSLKDAQPVISLLQKGGYSVSEGALEALGYDKMVPPEDQQLTILNMCWDLGSNRDKRSFIDPRYGLAAACAVRWSNKSGHKINLNLCSYGKEDKESASSEV